jgi:hypothetical protein
MAKKLIVGFVALTIALGVAVLVESNVRESAFRAAEAGRDLCFLQSGYDIGSAPDAVVRQCGSSMREYTDGETMRYVKAGLAGLAAAGLLVLLAWFFLFRRRQPAATPPPGV